MSTFLTTYYVAYDQDINFLSFKKRSKGVEVVGSTFLKNYMLTFAKNDLGTSCLNIEEVESLQTPIAIYKITNETADILEISKTFPLIYQKIYFLLNINDQIIECFTYVLINNSRATEKDLEIYSECLKGYKYFHFSASYIEQALNETPVEKRIKEIKKIYKINK